MMSSKLRAQLARFSIAGWLGLCPLKALARVEVVYPDTARLGNQFLERQFSLSDSKVKTVRLINRLSGDSVIMRSDEFLLRTYAGTELTGVDFQLTGEPVVQRDGEREQLIFRLVNTEHNIRLDMVLSLGRDEPFMRKQLVLRTEAEPAALVSDVEVERFRTPKEADLGGFGQPLFLPGDHFLGLEFPAGYAECRDGLVTLRHHPGRQLAREPWRTRSAAWGVAPKGEAESWFAKYLAAIRRRPRSFTVYNTWYDLRRGDLTPAVLLPKLELFRHNGVKLDSFVLDDGWQERQSIWAVDTGQYPQGFGPLARQLRQMGTDLGLWMPLTAVRTNLDLDWGAAQGYETSPDRRFYCLSGRKVNDAVRHALHQFIAVDGVNYFKHDFNAFACTSGEHTHLPSSLHGTEANVEAEIAMFEFMRRLRPDLYINPSGGMWLSPWWLMHVDTVWMRYCHDFGYEKRVPAPERRDWAMTYRDSMLWMNLRRDRCQFPVSAIMTIGIIYGKRNMLGGKDEPLDMWTDNVVLNCARGSMLKELYLTPELLSAEQWQILRESLGWAEANQHILARGRMILGDPAKGDVYGYEHILGERGIVCVRNPSLKPQTAAVSLARLPAGQTLLAMVVYPFRQVLSSSLKPDDPLVVELGSNELRVIELRPLGSLGEPVLEGCRYSVEARTDDGLRLALWAADRPSVPIRIQGAGSASATGAQDGIQQVAPDAWTATFPELFVPVKVVKDGEVRAVRGGITASVAVRTNCRFILLFEDATPPTPSVALEIDGERAELATTSGSGWVMHHRDMPAGEQRLDWHIDLDSRSAEPFLGASFQVSAWLLSKHELSSRTLAVQCLKATASRELPTPHARVRKETLLLAEAEQVELHSQCRTAAVSQQDLATAKTAKLHIAVFGSQGGQYSDKPILLNGTEIGKLPANGSPPDRWEKRIIDLETGLLPKLAVRNSIVVKDNAGDCLKVTDVALAVQLADGTWAETDHDSRIYCSAPGWLHDEGTPFRNKASPVITLSFRSQ